MKLDRWRGGAVLPAVSLQPPPPSAWTPLCSGREPRVPIEQLLADGYWPEQLVAYVTHMKGNINSNCVLNCWRLMAKSVNQMCTDECWCNNRDRGRKVTFTPSQEWVRSLQKQHSRDVNDGEGVLFKLHLGFVTSNEMNHYVFVAETTTNRLQIVSSLRRFIMFAVVFAVIDQASELDA